MTERATIIQIIFCWIVWIVTVIILNKSSRSPYKLNPRSRFIGILLILVFCVYNYIDGDYFHYKTMYIDAIHGLQYHMESVYFWIIDNIAKTYTLFRLIVWGGALMLLLATYKRIAEKPDLCLYYFFICFIPWFAYARASLAMAMILFGMSFIIKPLKRGKIISYALGFTVMGCAWFFHGSAIVGIVAAVASLFLMNGKRSTIIMLIVISPILLLLLRYAVDSFMTMDLSTEDMITSQKRDNYLQGGGGRSLFSGGIGFILQNLISLGGLYLTAVYFLVISIKGDFLRMPIQVRLYASYVFSIVIIAFSLAMLGSVDAYVLHYRTLFFAMPANAIFLCSMKFMEENKTFFRIILTASCIGAIYTLLYTTYRVMLNYV